MTYKIIQTLTRKTGSSATVAIGAEGSSDQTDDSND